MPTSEDEIDRRPSVEEIRLAAITLVEKTYSDLPGTPAAGATLVLLYGEAFIPAAKLVEAYVRGRQ